MTFQVFVRGLDGATTLLRTDRAVISGADLKTALRSRRTLPPLLSDRSDGSCDACDGCDGCDSFRVVTGTREISDTSLLSADAAGFFPSCHVIARVLGGKGGFGSLLRGAATKAGQKKTSNFDACRDMSGRRLRHVNAERKLKDWRHEARERQLEKTAQDYLKRLAKEKKKRREEVVDLGAVRKASHAAMARVADAVKSGMERHGLDKGKRKLSAEEEGEEEAERAQQAKRGKLLGMLEDIEEGEDDEEEDEEEGEEEEDEEEEDEEEEDEEEEDEEHEEGEEGTEKGGEEGSGSGSKEGSEGSGGAGSAGSAGSAGKAVAPLHSSSSDEERDEACHASRLPSAHSSALHHHEPQAQPQLVQQQQKVQEQQQQQKQESQQHQQQQQPPPPPPPQTQQTAAAAAAEGHIDLSLVHSATDLESLGLERLKQELQQRGLKCGGTLSERAARLFLLASTPVDQLDPKHLAGAAAGGKGRKSKGKL